MIPDTVLLSAYAEQSDEDAFSEFVRRHLSLVYFAALRRTGGRATLAEEIAQQVFVEAARKAASLAQHTAIVGWLYTTTRNVTTDMLRREHTRGRHEREAQRRHELMARETESDWEQLRPFIDAELDALSSADREAVLLRFFALRPFAEIGTALHTSEDAARMRVDRALGKLRTRLRARGFTSTAGALGAALAQQASLAAPVNLSATVCSAAFMGASGTGMASAAALLGFMSSTKLLVGISTVITVGCIGLVMMEADKTGRAVTAATAERILAEARMAELEQSLRTEQQAHAAAVARIGALEQQVTAPLQPSKRMVATATAENPAPNPQPLGNDEAAEKVKLHRRYDPFLKRYGLTPQQSQRFVELMLQKNQVRADMQAAVEQAGANGDDPRVSELRAKLDGHLWREIDELLGLQGRAAFAEYEKTSAYRVGMIDPMRPELTDAGADLSADQEDRLLSIIAANTDFYRQKATDLGSRRRWNWDAIATQARTVLTPAQLQVFEIHVSRWKSVIK